MSEVTSSSVRRSIAAFMPLALMIFCATALAGAVKCPVCKEVFDDTVEVCPNDGTELKLIGEPVKEEGGPSSEDTDRDTDSAASESPKERTAPNKAVPKYKRQDTGGARKRVTPAVEDDSTDGARRDRSRRIKDGRTRVDGERWLRWKQQEEARFKKSDTELRKRFEKSHHERLDNDSKAWTQGEVGRYKRESLPDPTLWTKAAPLVSMGFRLSFMGEGERPGPTLGSEIDVNFVRTSVRMGISTFVGTRKLGDRGDLMFLESVTLGLERPWRFAPYIVGRFGLGALLSERFGEDLVNFVRAMGFDVGVDCKLDSKVVVTPSIGYVRYSVNNADWDSVSLRLMVGF